jgi:hypothetical protein
MHIGDGQAEGEQDDCSAPPREEGAREPWWLPPSERAEWAALGSGGAAMPSKGGGGEARARGGPRRPRCIPVKYKSELHECACY